MDKIVGVVALVAILFLVGRGMPPRYRLLAVAGGLAFAVLILGAERLGLWPQSWSVR
jgi:peptidoglycan/LPS O-acetylase OafA/YrhL